VEQFNVAFWLLWRIRRLRVGRGSTRASQLKLAACSVTAETFSGQPLVEQQQNWHKSLRPYALCVTCYVVRVTRFVLRVTRYAVRGTCYALRVTRYALRIYALKS